jgi:hypothetical protein
MEDDGGRTSTSHGTSDKFAKVGHPPSEERSRQKKKRTSRKTVA